MMTRSVLAVPCFLVLATALRADVVHRRGTEPPLTGGVVKMDDNAISLRSDLGATHVVPWDRVRDVELDRSDARLEGYLATATELWRARSRVQRYDTTLAEPLLARLWPEFIGRTNETALIVAEGLLRCRLARSAFSESVLPALEVARLRRAGVETDRYGLLPPVLDDQLALSPLLAPAWSRGRALAKLPADLEEYDPGDDEIVAALAALYRHAALSQLGRPAGELPAELPEHPGVALLASSLRCVEADARDPDAARAAREQLLRSLTVLPEWAEAWVHHFVGISLVGAEGIDPVQEGLWHLAHLPAHFANDQPRLTDFALAHMVTALRGLGDERGAAALEAERQRLLAQ